MENRQQTQKALASAFMGYFIFGFCLFFTKQALAVATPFVLLSVRFTVAFLILIAILVVRRIKISVKGKPIGMLLLLGLLQPVCGFIGETYATALSPTSFVGIMMAMVPVISVTLGYVFLREKASTVQIICIVASAVGVAITTLGKNSGGFTWLGFGLLLITMLCSSFYQVLSRKISGKFTPFERTLFIVGMGSVAFTVLALIQCTGNMEALLFTPLRSRQFWVSIIYLSAMGSVAAYFCLNYALTYVHIAQISIFANMLTVIAISVGVLVLHEPFGIMQAVGSGIILTAVYIVNRVSLVKE